MYMYNEEIKGHIKKNLQIKYKQFINKKLPHSK